MDDSPLEQLAARLLREARTRAGLTQVELARRAGVTQSVISTYESAKRQPSMPMLVDLVRATGMQLTIQVEPTPGPTLDRLTGPLGRRLRERREEVLRVAEEHGLTNVRVFGSVARGEERPDSDVDLLADIRPGTGLWGMVAAQEELEAVLDSRVDLVPEAGLKDGVRESALEEAVAL